MRKSGIFWGIVIILAGLLLLSNTLQIVQFSFWKVFFPLALILLGVWFLMGPTMFRRDLTPQYSGMPLQGARAIDLKLAHGAGRLEIGASSNPAELLSGSFVGGVQSSATLEADGTLKAKVEAPTDIIMAFPWGYASHGLSWNVNLNRDLPMKLRLSTGASETNANLIDLKVTDLRIETGASNTQVTMPAQARFTRVQIETGASSINLRIPLGVAGRISIKSGLSNIKVDPSRFMRIGELYESADYATAANRVEIFVEAGVGSIDIR